MHRRLCVTGLLSLALAASLIGCGGGGGGYCPPTTYDNGYVAVDPPTDAPTDSPTDTPTDAPTDPPDNWAAKVRKPQVLRRAARSPAGRP